MHSAYVAFRTGIQHAKLTFVVVYVNIQSMTSHEVYMPSLPQNRRLSQLPEGHTAPSPGENSAAVVFVGSFAPFHSGHLDAAKAAVTAIRRSKMDWLSYLVLVPNSDDYVRAKLGNEFSDQFYLEERVRALQTSIMKISGEVGLPVYIDDVSGPEDGSNKINEIVPQTIQRLGYREPNPLYYIVGGDQLGSMKDYIGGNQGGDSYRRSVCVLRPGNLDSITQLPDWANSACYRGSLIVTARDNMDYDVSSTELRINCPVDA